MFICLGLFCDSAGARTQDPNIKSVVLYQLSYEINTLSFESGCKYNGLILFSKSRMKKT